MNMRLRMRLDLLLACRHTSRPILRGAAGNRFLYGLLGLLLGLVGLAAMPRLSVADAGALPTVMDQDPPVVLTETEAVFSDKLKPLWIEALRQPDSDLQRQAAETIARAHLRGMPELSDCGPILIEVLEGSDQHPAVQLACARALVQLEAEAAAAPLFEVAKRGSLDLALLVEPALGTLEIRSDSGILVPAIAGSQRSSPTFEVGRNGIGFEWRPARYRAHQAATDRLDAAVW